MPGKAPSALRRRGSDKYFISPANPRASHSPVCSSSGNFPADTTPQRSKPSSLARASTHMVSDLARIFPILPHLTPSGERGSIGVEGEQKLEPSHSAELAVAAQSAILVRVNLEDGEQLGQLQEIVHFFCQLQKLEAAASIFHSRVGADEFSDAGAVDVIDIGQIQKDEGTLIFQQLADSLSQKRAAFAERNTAADIDDGHAGSFTICGSQCHLDWAQASFFGAAPWPLLPLVPGFPDKGNFLDMMIYAPPVRPGTTSNSSMNARIRKMPRPEVLSRFSSARGLGTPPRSKPFPSSKT